MEKREDTDDFQIDLLEIAGLLLKKSWLILGVGAIMAGIFLGIGKFTLAPSYMSTTQIYILARADESTVTYEDVQMGKQLAMDYVKMVKSRAILEKVIKEEGLLMNYAELARKISVNTLEETRVVSITVEDSDPRKAMAIADCIREVASEYIQSIMGVDAVSVVDTASMPVENLGTKPMKVAMTGGVLGCLAVVVIILIRYFMDETIKTPDEIEKYLGICTLASIPLIENEAGGKKKKRKGK